MLIQLTIINFAIVRELKIHFQNGMTTITGETGAGKSIAIDALGLCLGERADASVVRMHTPRADICAHFSLHDAANAQTWLAKNHLDNNNDCLLRRVITNDGRSRGFINGIPVPLSQLRELGQLLIQIHGQHAHQLLLKPEYQRHLLDTYGNLSTQLTEMRQAYQQWHHSGHLLTEYQQQLTQREARRQLLEYQLTELNDFAPQPGEYESIDEEYRRQANSEKLLTLSQQALEIISDTEQHNILSLLHSVKKNITELAHYDPHFASLLAMLEEASIQVSEVKTELQHYHKKIEVDPGYLNQLEQRLSRQIALARKHHVAPEKLVELHQQLLAEQAILNQQESEQQQLAEDQQRFYQQTIHIAQQLHQQRVNIATELSEQITHRMRQLSMPHGHLTIEVTFTPETLTAEGADKIAFNVTTNPGQPLQSLTKVASGGELSRIALAIQVITAQKMDTPALIFDEIDVGISGPTAALVGHLLRQLGESTQVMCVTHLPQVAGCGHHHFYVSKQSDDKGTETHMQILDKKARLHELARLLGGSSVTRNTLANAKELLTT